MTKDTKETKEAKESKDAKEVKDTKGSNNKDKDKDKDKEKDKTPAPAVKAPGWNPTDPNYMYSDKFVADLVIKTKCEAKPGPDLRNLKHHPKFVFKLDDKLLAEALAQGKKLENVEIVPTDLKAKPKDGATKEGGAKDAKDQKDVSAPKAKPS